MDLFEATPLDEERVKDIVQGRASLAPKIVTVDITSVCNLSCVFCRSCSRWVRPFPKVEARLEEVLKAIDGFVSLGLEEVNISGDGEPTTHPKFKWFVKELLNRGLKVNVSTNLTTSDPEVIDLLSRVDSVGVNLCSLSNYKGIHGQDLMKRVVSNLVELLNCINRRQFATSVDIDFVLSRPTLKYALEVVALAKRLGIGVEFVVVYGEELPPELFLEDSDFLSVLSKAAKLYPKGTNAGWFLDRKSSPFRFQRCFVGWFHCFIDVFGKVYFCCQNPWTEFGFFTADLVDVWFSPEAQKKRNFVVDFNPDRSEECRYCTDAPLLKWVETRVGGVKKW